LETFRKLIEEGKLLEDKEKGSNILSRWIFNCLNTTKGWYGNDSSEALAIHRASTYENTVRILEMFVEKESIRRSEVHVPSPLTTHKHFPKPKLDYGCPFATLFTNQPCH
jgi:hypothetical protein